MRTGDEYRQALRDGRRVWVVGDGLIKDVTLHPATRPMVDEYVAWYDRHRDPAWQDVVLTPPDERGARAQGRSRCLGRRIIGCASCCKASAEDG